MRRFKSQILLSQNAILAAMAYVDLNPVRAKIVGSLGNSKNTGIKPAHEENREKSNACRWTSCADCWLNDVSAAKAQRSGIH